MSLYRIDNRLLHGQVLQAWIPSMDATLAAIVSDEVRQDEDRQQILSMAAPPTLNVVFWSVQEAGQQAAAVAKDPQARAVLLFPRPHEVVRMIEAGAPKPSEINVGGMHYAMSRVTLGKFMTFSEEDKVELLKLTQMGVKLDARATPHDAPADLTQLLKG